MDMDMDKADAIFLFAGQNKYKYTSANTAINKYSNKQIHRMYKALGKG